MQVMGGLYYHRLKMAHVLLVALGPQVARHLVLPMRPVRRAAEAMALAACMAALGLTYARAAYLGAAGGAWACAMGLAYYRPSLRRRLVAWVVVIGLSVCVALAMSPAVRQRLLSVRGQDAAKVRQVIWTQAIAMTHAHPWGVGLGNYPQVVGPYYHLADPFDPSPITYPHSMVWMAWAEAGPVGLIAWLFFWLSTLTDALRGLAAAQATRTQQVAAGAWLFIGTALGLVGLTHDVLFHNIVALTFFAALGCTRVLMRENIR
jgi:O-antigen ligase